MEVITKRISSYTKSNSSDYQDRSYNYRSRQGISLDNRT